MFTNKNVITLSTKKSAAYALASSKVKSIKQIIYIYLENAFYSIEKGACGVCPNLRKVLYEKKRRKTDVCSHKKDFVPD